MLDKLKKKVKGKKVRPYWHVDAKWITGILMLFVLSLTLVFVNLARITSEDNAIEAIATYNALFASPLGLETEEGIDELKQNGIEGYNFTFDESEFEGMSAREVRLHVFRRVAEPFYEGGAQALVEYAATDEVREALETNGDGLLVFLEKQMHMVMLGIAAILSLICLILLVPLVLFSSGFGRFASPGFVLLLTSAPVYFASSFASTYLASVDNTFTGWEEGGLVEGGRYMALTLAPLIVDIIHSTYSLAALLGLILVIVAIVGGIVKKSKAKK